MTNPSQCEHVSDHKDENDVELFSIVTRYFQLLGLLLYGYLIGHLGLSIWWLYTASAVFVLKRNYISGQFAQRTVKYQEFIGDFKKAIAFDEPIVKNLTKYLPSWVHFPDTERAEWLNQVFRQLWPFVDEYLQQVLRSKIEQNINDTLPDLLKGFRFASINFGSVPVRVGSVKCHEKNTARDEIILDLEVIYIGNCDIEVRLKGLHAGIKDFRLQGILRVELRRLTKQWPMIECVSLYFLQNPQIDYTFTKWGALLHLPGLEYYLKKSIMNQFAKRIVLPNKHVIPLVPHIELAKYKFAQPIAVLQLEVIEAQNLKKSFTGMLGFGMVYANISIGNEERTTSTSTNLSKPKWNFKWEVLVYYLSQVITLEVMYSGDKHVEADKDEYLGNVHFSVEIIAKQSFIDQWFDLITLKDEKKGEIHLKAFWKAMKHEKPINAPNVEGKRTKQFKQNVTTKECPDGDVFLSDYLPPNPLSYIIDPLENEHIHNIDVSSTFSITNQSFLISTSTEFSQVDDQSASNISSACLVIYLDCAKDLPICPNTYSEPSCQVVLTLPSQQPQKSEIQTFTCNPSWGEHFEFLLDQVDENQNLLIEVTNTMAGESNRHLGQSSISLKSVIESPDMTLTKPLLVRSYNFNDNHHFELYLSVSLYYLSLSRFNEIEDEQQITDGEESLDYNFEQ